jgi:hypothetical protein
MLLPALVLGLLACPLACLGLLHFDVHSSATTRIQGSMLPAGFAGFNGFDLAQQEAFKNENTRKDHITSARLTELTMKTIAPAGADLSFFSSVKFWISAPNLPRVEIAHLASFPRGQTQVTFQLDDVELQDYAKADSISITTEAVGNAPQQTTDVQADLTLTIHASPL